MSPFSVLMSVYAKESRENLHQALESVFVQTLRPAEVVIVKDGPLPGDLDALLDDFAARYPEIRLVPLPQNSGLGRALNAGLQVCSYSIVARMDSDDICLPDRFEKQISRMLKDENVALIGASVAEFAHDPAQIECVRHVPQTHEEIVRRFGYICPVNHPTVVYRKEAVEKCGGYSQEFVQEDYHLWAKMVKSGCRFENIDEPLVLMRTGEGLYGRRGGLKYAVSEARLQVEFWRMGLINLGQLAFNVLTRTSVRLMPTGFRKRVYQLLLRRSDGIEELKIRNSGVAGSR